MKAIQKYCYELCVIHRMGRVSIAYVNACVEETEY